MSNSARSATSVAATALAAASPDATALAAAEGASAGGHAGADVPPPAPEVRLAFMTANASAVATSEIAAVDVSAFRDEVLRACRAEGRLVALFAAGKSELIAVIAHDQRSRLSITRAALAGDAYPALATELPAAQAFEREIYETHGIRPEGHPWLKPLRRHIDLEPPPGAEASHSPSADAGRPPSAVASPRHRADASHPFFRFDGPSLHEVAVGPVHAGIIEPGHFRFQCAGEQVLHLEIQLGYQHRRVEPLLLSSAPERALAVAESIAGDTAVGHAVAFAAAIEGLAGIEVPLRGQTLRGIALELERLANHVGDLGALCNDVAYLPGASWLGRWRGELLNLLLELSGNRFGRGLVRVGGVRYDLTPAQQRAFGARVGQIERNVRDILDIVFGTPSVASRFERTGTLARDDAEAVGLVGPAARASGCDRDARRDHPLGIYCYAHVPTAVAETGDVMARALVRAVETKRSLAFLREQLHEIPLGPVAGESARPRPGRTVVSLVEGWRGEIAHIAVTDTSGRLAAYKVVDPSFHNWLGLALAMRGQPISDFPLCNKSFNLSYAGHDL